MKYLVIYQMEGFRSARAFSSHGDAVDYVNECTDIIDDSISELKTLDDSHHRMTLKNGKIFNITIERVDDSKIRYDLIYDRNGRHIETRRFTERQLAVYRAHKVLDKDDFAVDKDEDKIGEWFASSPEEDIEIALALKLVILGSSKFSSSDYSILGVKSSATEEEVRSAYRTMSKKYHPDAGGDPAKFAEIHEAYERIKNGEARGSSHPVVVESYNSTDMRCFFTNLREKIANASEYAAKDKEAAYAIIRAAALKLLGRGIAWLIAGGLLVAAFSSVKPFPVIIGIFTYMAIIYGFRLTARGIIFLISPGSAMKYLK